jgi:hypothetical protein
MCGADLDGSLLSAAGRIMSGRHGGIPREACRRQDPPEAGSVRLPWGQVRPKPAPSHPRNSRFLRIRQKKYRTLIGARGLVRPEFGRQTGRSVQDSSDRVGVLALGQSGNHPAMADSVLNDFTEPAISEPQGVIDDILR